MNSLKTEFREHLFFYEKHLGWIPLVIFFSMITQLAIPETFSTASMSDYAVYSGSFDDTFLIAGAFTILTGIVQLSIFFVSFLYACAIRFGTEPYSKFRRFTLLFDIARRLMGGFTTEELFSTKSKLPKFDSESNNSTLRKQCKQQEKEIRQLRIDKINSEKKIKELEKQLSDKDKNND